jgi:hypothetical protein
MYFRKLIIGAALIVAPLQASILSVGIDPLLPILQTFATPNLGANVANVTNQFSGVTFTPGQTVVYDPNQASGGTCASWGAPDANCVSNFTENADASYKTITGTSLTFTLINPATEVAFYLIWDMYPGAGTLTQIAVNGGQILTAGGPQASFTQSQGGWFDVNLNGALINSVTITGLGANTSVAPNGSGYGLVLSHIEATTPEPGTIMLLGAGLGAVGFFARRRKA